MGIFLSKELSSHMQKRLSYLLPNAEHSPVLQLCPQNEYFTPKSNRAMFLLELGVEKNKISEKRSIRRTPSTPTGHAVIRRKFTFSTSESPDMMAKYPQSPVSSDLSYGSPMQLL